jgi:hypothetical protein
VASISKPALCIIEYYQLTTAPGDLGITRNIVDTINIPGHSKRTQSIRTRHESSSSTSTTSSAIESQDASVAKNLSQSLHTSADQSFAEDHSAWQFDASFYGEVDVGLTGGSADATAHASSSSAAVHDAYRNAVEQAVQQQVAQTDKYRTERKSERQDSQSNLEEGESISTFEIDNLNNPESCTYLLVQLSIERLTALSLINAQIGFFDPRTNRLETVPLSGLDDLLARVIADAGNRATVRAALLQQLTTVMDYHDEPRPFVEERPMPPGSARPTFLRVIPDLVTDVSIRRVDGAVKKFTVPGIALKTSYRVLAIPQIGMARSAAGA